MSLSWLLIQFAICALLVARAGYVLSDSADRLAEAHGWGRGWVGIAMLATVTSLPELASGISAVAWVHEPNLAVGDALGSCVFNLGFLVVIDGLHRHRPMYQEASPSHLLSAGFGIVMLGLVAVSLMLGPQLPSIGRLGWSSLVMVLLYLFALRAVYRREQPPLGAVEHPTRHGADTKRQWRRFSVATLVVLAAGTWLPNVADRMAEVAGLDHSFVGTLWLAFVTSLPEMTVTLASLRLGKLDLAIANLLGSNMFNVVVLAVDDAFYAQGVLLAHAAPVHMGTAVTAMTMTGLVIVGLVMRPHGRVLRTVSWVSVGLAAACAVNAALVYLKGQ